MVKIPTPTSTGLRMSTQALSSDAIFDKAWCIPLIGSQTIRGDKGSEVCTSGNTFSCIILIHVRSAAFAGPVVPDYPPGLKVTVTLIPKDANVAETVGVYVPRRVSSSPITSNSSSILGIPTTVLMFLLTSAQGVSRIKRLSGRTTVRRKISPTALIINRTCVLQTGPYPSA